MIFFIVDFRLEMRCLEFSVWNLKIEMSGKDLHKNHHKHMPDQRRVLSLVKPPKQALIPVSWFFFKAQIASPPMLEVVPQAIPLGNHVAILGVTGCLQYLH
jgi:hypothetical protein